MHVCYFRIFFPFLSRFYLRSSSSRLFLYYNYYYYYYYYVITFPCLLLLRHCYASNHSPRRNQVFSVFSLSSSFFLFLLFFLSLKNGKFSSNFLSMYFLHVAIGIWRRRAPALCAHDRAVLLPSFLYLIFFPLLNRILYIMGHCHGDGSSYATEIRTLAI